MYHTKKIGVFVSHIVGEYQRNICQGIIDQASEYGYCVEIFSSTDEKIPGNYRLGEESILRIPNFDNLCGIIFISSTYVTSNLPQLISKTLEGCRCPILEITQQHGQYPSIMLDNDTGTGQLTEHLIGTHGYKRVCYLGNTLETFFSDNRCNIYKQVMAKHNLPVTAQDIYECTYDSRDLEAAVEYFTATGKPDAIVCYNDRMALGMIRALLDKGYRVPEDFAVTGTDMLEEGQYIDPPLTSVTFPTKEMGIRAVELLLSALHGKELPPVTVITSDPHIGGSCGCPAKHHKNPFYFQHDMALKVGQNEATSTDNIHMAASLLATVDINEGMELLENFVSQISGCSELYLCLYSDWDSVSSHIRTITFSEDDSEDRAVMLLKFAYKNGKRMHECSFTKQNPLPDYLSDNEASSYIFYPLYFSEKAYGYIAIAYEDNQIICEVDFLSWIMNINSMLHNIAENKRTGLLVNRLEEIYMHDEMTGLYNRHGYKLLSEELLEKMQDTGTRISSFVLDLAGLKYINDTYGHSEGDFAICVLGHALKNAVRDGDICARLGGDEFYLLTAGYSDEEITLVIYKINQYLDNYNKLHTKKYHVSASIGAASETISPDFDLKQLTEKADRAMYEQKRSKPKHRK